MTGRLRDKVTVITGGNSGLGFAATKLFQAEGATVVITGRRQEALDSAVEELGGDSIAIRSDASNLEDIAELYDNIKHKFGRIDVLYLNAGIGRFGPSAEVSEETFDEVIGVNLKGVFFSVQKALPLLSAGASVILTTSIAAQKGFLGTARLQRDARRFRRTWYSSESHRRTACSWMPRIGRDQSDR